MYFQPHSDIPDDETMSTNHIWVGVQTAAPPLLREGHNLGSSSTDTGTICGATQCTPAYTNIGAGSTYSAYRLVLVVCCVGMVTLARTAYTCQRRGCSLRGVWAAGLRLPMFYSEVQNTRFHTAKRVRDIFAVERGRPTSGSNQ